METDPEQIKQLQKRAEEMAVWIERKVCYTYNLNEYNI
jgi:hypothetical protein